MSYYSDTVLADTPLAYWRQSSSADASGNGRTLTGFGGLAFGGAPGAIAGDPDAATLYDGVDDYVSTGLTVAGAGLTTAVTAELWARSATASTQVRSPFGSQPAAVDVEPLTLFCVNGVPWLRVTTTAGAVTVTAGAWADGQWVHLAGTYDGAAARLYVNGSLVAAAPQSGSLVTNGGPWVIGRRGAGGGAGTYHFAGQVDEVAVYPSALSAARVLAHYNAGLSSGSLLLRRRRGA